MCRLVAYLGANIVMDTVLVKPRNSIIMQSLHARESKVPTNGDGFGVGWYAPAISPEPGLFTSISPAWSDRNLLSLASKIASPCFFGHVRAASSGGINTYNCHPFVYKEWMLMHNGEIYDFIKVKRHLRRLLDDELYQWIKGETDSEHLFALFLQRAKDKDLSQLNIVADVLQATLQEIVELVKVFTDNNEPSYFNLCLTDGKRLIACRYCSDPREKPESMHYITDSQLIKRIQKRQKTNINITPFVLVASERLNSIRRFWHDVPANHLLLVDEDLHITLRPL